MEVMFPHSEGNYYYISRMPKILEDSYGFLLPFTTLIWIIIIVSLLCLSIMFYITYSIYSIPELLYAGLYKSEKSAFNFFLYTICKLTEPDPLPWFTSKWSTGKYLTFIWSMYCLLLTFFYNCNLRAHLSAVDYEKPLDNSYDVIQHGKRPWIMIEMLSNK